MVLSCGIAIAMSMFNLYWTIYYTEVPYKDSAHMVYVRRVNNRNEQSSRWPIESYHQFREKQQIFSNILAFVPDDVSIISGENYRLITAAYIEHDFEAKLGIHPVLGRTFSADDAKPDTERVIVISYSLWESMFSFDPEILGKTITTDGVIRTIVGVMSTDFEGPRPLNGIDAWIPLNLTTITEDTGWVNFVMMDGIVRHDLSEEAASEQATILMQHIANDLPAENKDITGVKLMYMNDPDSRGNSRNMLMSLLICSILVLLMACGITSGLMTTRYSLRSQELAVKTALGASRFRIVGDILIEFTVISISSVIFCILLFKWFDISFLRPSLEANGVPAFMLNTNMAASIAFILITLLVVTLASTLMPALRASKVDIATVLSESTRTGSALRITRLSNFLVVWQVATATMILTSGAIVGYLIYDMRPGLETFSPKDYMCARIAFNARDHDDREAKCREVLQIQRELIADPRIEKACFTNEIFGNFQWGLNDNRVYVEGKDYPNETDAPITLNRIVSPGYFTALNVPILSGRNFTEQDDSSNHAVIVTDVFARKYFDTTDIIGKRIKFSKDGDYASIIGIVPDIYNPRGKTDYDTGIFQAYAEIPWDDIAIFAKGTGDNKETSKAITEVISRIDSKICIAYIMPLVEARTQSGPSSYFEFLIVILCILSIVSLLMTSAGLYGIISFSVNSRKTETGIRLALGGKPERVMLMLVRRSAIFVAVGLLIGVAGAYFIRRALIEQLQFFSENLIVYVAALLTIISVATIAIIIPAAMSISKDPFKILHEN